MNNNLSELSKPVAWPNGCNETAVNALRYLAENKRPIGGSDMYNTEHLYMIAREVERMSSPHLYSQEYVSALLAELESKSAYAADWCHLATKRKDELEDANKRIAELEAIRSDASQVFKEIGSELGCNPDNESIMMAIDALKERLATPVRLPEREFDDGSDKQVCILAGRFNSGIDNSAEAIRAAGFKCVGDEQ